MGATDYCANPSKLIFVNSACTSCIKTCSGGFSTPHSCSNYQEREVITTIDSYVIFEPEIVQIAKHKSKNPLDKIREKKNWKAIQEQHRRR